MWRQRWSRFFWFVLCCAAAGCSRDEAPTSDLGMVDARGDAASASPVADVGEQDDVELGVVHDLSGPQPCGSAPEAPREVITPRAGELYYEQVGLGGFALGEAAIVIGGDGTVLLIDVGNDSHSDDILDRLQALGRSTLNHVVVTHFHADHGDGLSEVLDRTGLAGRLVHRGITDRTNAANGGTMDEVADVAGQFPSADLPLCAEPACSGLGETLALGTGTVRFIAANATIAGQRYEGEVGPLQAEDSNGENARSVVGVIEHGAFRLLFAGDLTGGGSDTDDVESFVAARIDQVSDIDGRGVDVLHAGHHGRDTSSNATWVSRLLPSGDRNVVMGVSTAHLRSPHAEALDAFVGALGEGRIWTTRVATGGARSDDLVTAAGGRIVLSTLESGDAYAIQAIGEDGELIESRAFRSIRSCR